jgi:hypothetical protein
MVTVFSGAETWREGLAGDDTDREGFGRAALSACAQLGEHWQKRLAATKADKQITGFTADASSRNFETCGNHDFGCKFTSGNRPART